MKESSAIPDVADVKQTKATPMSNREFKRWLESEAAQALLVRLRAQGRTIDNVRWPDREREGRAGQSTGEKTVDLIFEEDGKLVGLDIIELHESQRHGRQHAEMGRIVGRLEKELEPSIKAIQPGRSVAISWSLNWLPDGRILRAGLKAVKAAIEAAAPAATPGSEIVVDQLPDFVARLELLCWESATPAFGFMTTHENQSYWVGEAAESMAEFLLSSSKPQQLQDFDDARVLAIDRALMPIPAELRASFQARRDRIPANWTAIYFMIPGAPESLTAVWER